MIRRKRASFGSSHGPPPTATSTASSTGCSSHAAPIPAAGCVTFNDGTSFSGRPASNPR
ncbi:hypothetical protein ACWEPN_36425 [Nonomuraea wenchangensis]